MNRGGESSQHRRRSHLGSTARPLTTENSTSNLKGSSYIQSPGTTDVPLQYMSTAAVSAPGPRSGDGDGSQSLTFVEPGNMRGKYLSGPEDVTPDTPTIDIYPGHPLCPGGGGAGAGSFNGRWSGANRHANMTVHVPGSSAWDLQQQKKSTSTDDMYVADDWKPEHGKAECEDMVMSSGNEGNDTTQLLTGEGTMKATLSRAPVPFCCLPGNPKYTFLAGMLLIMVLFLCVPVVTLLSTRPFFDYLSQDLPHSINMYVDAAKMYVYVDSLNDITLLFAYFGDYLPEEMMEDAIRYHASSFHSSLVSNDGTYISKGVLSMEYYIVSILDTLNTLSSDDISAEAIDAVRDLVADYYDDGFLEFINAVLKEQGNVAQANTRAYIRDNIFHSLYTSEAAATIARGPNLMQEARVACMDLEPCWTGGGREKIEEVAVLVAKIVAACSAVINDVFSIIEDPRVNATNLQEMVTVNLQRAQSRSDTLKAMADWYADLSELLNAFTELANSAPDPGDPVPVTPESLALFAVPPGWQSAVDAAVLKTREVTQAVNDYYLVRSPIPDWLSQGADAELSADLSEEEILSAVRVFNSFFGIDIAKSLTIDATPEMEAENTVKFENGKTISFLKELKEAVITVDDQAESALLTHLEISKDYFVEKMQTPSVATLCTSLGLSLVLYCTVIYVVRYRLTGSPFSFFALCFVMLVMFALQVGMSVGIFLVSKHAIVKERAITPAFLADIVKSLDIVHDLSSALSGALQLSLLVEPSYTAAEQAFKLLQQQIETMKVEVKKRPWMNSSTKFLEIAEELLAGGFYPIREQLMESSALWLTMEDLGEKFGVELLGPGGDLVTLNPDMSLYASCWAGVGAAATNTVSSSFVMVTVISERLSGGISSIETLKSGGLTRASLEGNCVAAALESVMDPLKPRCFLPEVCGSPPQYGLLRDVESSVGVYMLFNPSYDDAMGELLNVWVEAGMEAIPHQFAVSLESMITAADMDVHVVTLTRRLVVWMSVFTCLAMQLIALFLWQVLFGSSFFGKWLM